MRIGFRKLLSLCLLGVSPLACAADVPDAAMNAWLRARITLDATGKLTAIEWPDAKPKAKLLTDRLEQAVRGWKFEPGKLDGVPAVTQTGLWLNIDAKENAEGGLALTIKDAMTGVQVDSMPPPAYPVSQARGGHSAEVRLQVEIDENGKVASANVLEYDGDSKAKWSRADFEMAGLQAVKAWLFIPEQVGGKALRSQAVVPITFCVDNKWCMAKEKQRSMAGQQALPSGTAVALDSVVKIKTDFAGAKI